MTELSGSLEEKIVTPAPTPVAEVKPPVEAPKVVEPAKQVKVEPKPEPKADTQYRLNVFNTAGNIKPSVPVPVYQDMCRRNAEIIRSLSSTRWMTMDDILQKVWQLEKKMRYPSNRTRKSVETAIKELMEREMVVTR
jgi:hypothetical protein